MGISSSFRLFLIIWGALGSLLFLAFGILSKKYSGNPEKSKYIIIMGFTYLGVQIAGVLINISTYTRILDSTWIKEYYSLLNISPDIAGITANIIAGIITFSTVIGHIIGITLPILLIVGGFKLNKVKTGNISEFIK